MYNTITSVELNENEYDLTIFLDNGSFIHFYTTGDCCSASWFEHIDETKLINRNNVGDNELIGDFSQLVGKQIDFSTKCAEITYLKIDYQDSNVQECDDNTKCIIHLVSEDFIFMDRNSSNGYYGSCNSINYSNDAELIEQCKLSPLNKDANVTLVIGLPCSGKSFYCKEHFIPENIYDDFFFCYSKREILERILKGENIAINDPRLCIHSNIRDLINFLLKILSSTQIKCIQFKNNLETCLSNCRILHMDNKIDDIISLHKEYTKVSRYHGLDVTYLDVYKIPSPENEVENEEEMDVEIEMEVEMEIEIKADVLSLIYKTLKDQESLIKILQDRVTELEKNR